MLHKYLFIAHFKSLLFLDQPPKPVDSPHKSGTSELIQGAGALSLSPGKNIPFIWNKLVRHFYFVFVFF